MSEIMGMMEALMEICFFSTIGVPMEILESIGMTEVPKKAL